MGNEKGRISTVHIVGESIPAAYYSAIKAVHEQGYDVRTEYDRRDLSGDFIDPAGKDESYD